MASKYFYVHNGLTVGDLTIDAESSSLLTTGTITASNITVSGAAVLTTASIASNAVSSLIAGTDTAVSASVGSVTVWNTSTLQSITSRGSTTNQAVSITNATQSSSTTTGSLIVTGGVGVGKDLYVGGTIYSSGTAVQTQLVSGTNIKTIDGTSLLGSGDYSVLPTVAAATGDIIGVVNRSQATLSFNDSTRTFTVTPTTSSWDLYYFGTPKTVTTTTSVVISNTDGARWIKLDPNTLQLVEFFGAPNFESNINLAYIYWSTVTNHGLIVGDERHGSKRDTTWHSVTHLNVGTVWRSGGALTYTLNSSTNVNLSVGTPWVIQDEDLTHTITHSATPNGYYQQVLDGAAELEVLYLTGAATYSYTTATSTPWIAGSSLAAYNFNNSGSWTLADASEGDYITYWLLATNDIRSPVKLVLGRVTHTSLNDAYAEEFVEYGLNFAEQVFAYQIVVQTSSAYTGNAAKVQIAGVRKILSKSATSAAATVAATNHNDLTGRDVDNAHSISAITGLQDALDNKQDTLVSGTNIKTINGDSILGSGNLVIGSATTSTNIAGGAAGQLVYQSAPGSTAFIATGTGGFVLQANGTAAPSWVPVSGVSAGSATTASNLAAGTAGQIPYQTAPSSTSFFGPGTAGQILVSGGTGAPSYTNTSSIYVGRSVDADKWTTARTVTFTGDTTGTFSIDGSSNVSNVNLTIQPNSVILGTDTTGDYVATGATSGFGLSGSTTGENQTFTVTSNATSTNANSTIVFRDGSGNFSAGTITASLTGNVTGTATTATNIAGGAQGSIPIQSAAGITAYIPIGSPNFVLQSNGTTATWVSTSSLGISGGSGSAFNGGTITTALIINSSTQATSTDSGALQVINGGAGIGGNLFVGGVVVGGGVRTTSSTTAPTNPTVGDIWYETANDVVYRYTNDGTTSYWIDITGPTLAAAVSQYATLTGVETLTNKRVTLRVSNNGATTSGTITPAGDSSDQYEVLGLTGGITLAAPSGTPTAGQKLLLRIKDNGTTRTIAWTTSSGAYRAIGVTLTTATTANKNIYVGCVYNSTDVFWDVVALSQEA
jgi:hypothetical protein